MSEVTVVIPNYNGIAYLKICLQSLKVQQYNDFEILVVDNGSTDDSVSWMKAEYPEVKILALEKNYGFSVAANKGIQKANTDFVILLNNDTEVEPQFVGALLREIKHSANIFSCQAKMLSYHERWKMDDGGDFYSALGWAFARGKGQPEKNYNKRSLIFASCAGAAIYRKAILEKIGFFDERHFAYLEDIDVGYRAQIFGYTNIFCPTARIYHIGSATSGSRYNGLKVRLSARNSIYLAYKNMPLPQLILNSPLLGMGILIKFVFFTRKHLGKEYRAGVKQGISLCKKENKVRYCRKNLINYTKIQIELWKNVIRRLRKF